VALCIMTLASCRESMAPAPPPLTLGTFHLQRVDGNPLPQQIVFSSSSCVVTAATLELFADTTFLWRNTCEPSHPEDFVTVAFSGNFRQAARDSVEFPVFPSRFAPPPVAMARKNGDSLIVMTSGASSLFGAHRWSFRETQ